MGASRLSGRSAIGRCRVLLVVLALGGAACGGDDDSDTPAGAGADTSATHEEVIETYRTAYNAGDIDAVMALFTEDSVLIDHPTALFGGVGDGGNSLTGLVEIREANDVDRGTAAEIDAYEFLNVEDEGDTISWDHTWEGLNGAEWCGEGHSAVIAEGKFVSWNYAPDTHPCSPDCSFDDAVGDNPPEACRR